MDCFAAYEERTRMVPVEGSDPPAEAEDIYTVAIPIEDMETVWRNIAAMSTDPTAEQKQNAGSVYSLIRYGYTGGANGSGFAGADVPFIGADGFCSPIGPNWRNVITSEFGYRKDPFTGKTKGHSGMDLAVPTGTSIRAALPGTVTVSTYNQGGYGYYIMIDHGGGLVTLYGHCSQLAGAGGPDGGGRRRDCPVRLHRAVYRAASALRGPPQRPADQPQKLLAVRRTHL